MSTVSDWRSHAEDTLPRPVFYRDTTFYCDEQRFRRMDEPDASNRRVGNLREHRRVIPGAAGQASFCSTGCVRKFMMVK